MADDENFYVFANKKDNKLGYYLFQINIKDPRKPKYLINWKDKLDIADCDLQLMEEDGQKSMVISFKSIGINTFNVVVIDLLKNSFRFWHESYQLWESPVKGFLMASNEFLTLSKDGMAIIALG